MNAQSQYPAEFSRFFTYVVAMSLSGLVGVVLLGIPATRTYNRLRRVYVDEPGLRGEWIIRWGWLIIVGFGLLVTILLVILLLRVLA